MGDIPERMGWDRTGRVGYGLVLWIMYYTWLLKWKYQDCSEVLWLYPLLTN
jgi:hypothetical protein